METVVKKISKHKISENKQMSAIINLFECQRFVGTSAVFIRISEYKIKSKNEVT